MSHLPSLVSLFCGAGGMDLGFSQAGFPIPVAFDWSDSAIRSHKRNLPDTDAIVADLLLLGPSGVAEAVKKRVPPNTAIGVIGGPPCQGFSRANTTSHESDPRNELAELYVAIVAELQAIYRIDFVVLENVPGIRDAKHLPQYRRITDSLAGLGLDLAERQLCALDFGVPQRRHRLLVTGVRAPHSAARTEPVKSAGISTVQQAIGHIDQEPTFFSKGLLPDNISLHPNHWTMRPRSPRFSDPTLAGTDGRSFKRLQWNVASPTIAFGHREIYVHPTGHRRLSIYEALLLQGFPAAFVLDGNLSEQVEQVSNAVPPPLALGVANGIRRSLADQDD